jgi:hypothetical protein
MGGNDSLMIEEFAASPAREVFALTDEQILGLEPEEVLTDHAGDTKGSTTEGNRRGAVAETLPPDNPSQGARKGAQAGLPTPQEPPAWLAREMKDPWVGDEARELWEGAQRAEREATAYREAFATPEDARALKEIYPGGVAEAKSVAERARELNEIDLIFFGAAGKPPEELRAGRVQLVERLYAQHPGALREMVEAGIRILGGNGIPHGDAPAANQNSTITARALDAEPQSAGEAQAGVPMPQEVVSRYREFERTTNAQLEKSVGGAIARAMEAALPNLRHAAVGGSGREGQATPLQERLTAAVREDVEAALKNDAALGEQVAKTLSGRRFDGAARAQVVRLIDTRAQQLVPGAVRRVVGSWTQATLGGSRREVGSAGPERGERERPSERLSTPSRQTEKNDRPSARTERPARITVGHNTSRGRVDYRKYSDEQILEM